MREAASFEYGIVFNKYHTTPFGFFFSLLELREETIIESDVFI